MAVKRKDSKPSASHIPDPKSLVPEKRDTFAESSDVGIDNSGKIVLDGPELNRKVTKKLLGNNDSGDLSPEEKDNKRRKELEAQAAKAMLRAIRESSESFGTFALFTSMIAPHDKDLSAFASGFNSVKDFDSGIEHLENISHIVHSHGQGAHLASLDFSGFTSSSGSIPTPSWNKIKPDPVRVGSNVQLDGSFNQAFKVILANEGGFANHRLDKGGATIYGISSVHNPKEYQSIMEALRNGDKDSATQITMQTYKQKYWDKIDGIENLSNEAKLVAFDAAVNHGVGYANKMVARVGDNADQMLAYRANTYSRIIEHDHSQEVFAKGWSNRLAKLDAIADNQGRSQLALAGKEITAEDRAKTEATLAIGKAQASSKLALETAAPTLTPNGA